MLTRSKRNPLFWAGFVLGLGFGGFFDGILLHQILGWHHLVCRTDTCQPLDVASLLRQNTEYGWFHFAVWITSLAGTALLFNARQVAGSGLSVIGSMLAGWGTFNLVEGLVNHQLLGIHHVRPGSPHELVFDLLFLAMGVALIVAGCAIYQTDRRKGVTERV